MDFRSKEALKEWEVLIWPREMANNREAIVKAIIQYGTKDGYHPLLLSHMRMCVREFRYSAEEQLMWAYVMHDVLQNTWSIVNQAFQVRVTKGQRVAAGRAHRTAIFAKDLFKNAGLPPTRIVGSGEDGQWAKDFGWESNHG